MASVKMCLGILHECGVETSSVIDEYVRKIVDFSRNTDLVPNWILQGKSGKMMDDHLLLGGLSEMDFPLGTVVPHPNTNEKILALSKMTGNTSQNISELVERFRWVMSRGSSSKVVIPLADNRHWAIVVVENEKIWWGDSLNQEPFGTSTRNVLTVVQEMMKKMFPSDSWDIQKIVQNGSEKYENYMTDVLGLQCQRDGYSCGFYVMATIARFAYSIGELPGYQYNTYSSEITELYREACMRGYMKRVEETKVARNGRRFSDLDVMVYISQNRLRFFRTYQVTGDEEAEKREVNCRNQRVANDESVKEFGVKASDLDEYVELLKDNKEFYNYRREYKMRNKEFTRRLMYTCFRERSGCKATLIARWYPNEDVWRLTKRGVHNHEPSIPKPIFPAPKRKTLM